MEERCHNSSDDLKRVQTDRVSCEADRGLSPSEGAEPRCDNNVYDMSNADGAVENIDLRKLEMGEDHTLGNALRCMLSKNPEVSFCGYCIPHPSETKINLRIQSFNRPAVDCLQQGLTNLHSLGKHVLDTFEKAVATYKNNSASRESSMEIDGAGR